MLECVMESQVQKTSHAAGYYHWVACHKLFLFHQAVTKGFNGQGRMMGGLEWWCLLDRWDLHQTRWTLKSCRGHKATCWGYHVYFPENIVLTFKSGHESLMAWACVTHNWKGPIMHLNFVLEVTATTSKKKGGGLNGPYYVDQILETLWRNFWTWLRKRRVWRHLLLKGILVTEMQLWRMSIVSSGSQTLSTYHLHQIQMPLNLFGWSS